MKDLMLRKQELKEDCMLRRIKRVAECRVQLREGMWCYLLEQGITAEEADGMEPESKALSRGKLARQKTKEKLKTLPAVPDDEVDPKDLIHSGRYRTLGDLTIKVFRDQLLGPCDPSVLTKHNLRALEKNEGKDLMLQLLEFCTGLPPTFALQSPYNRYSSVLKLVVERARMRPMRCSGMVIPPLWPRDGLWSIIALTDDGLELQHRFLHQKFVIAKQDLPPHDSLKDLYLHENFSEERSAIASVKDIQLMRKYLLTRLAPLHVRPGDAAEEGAASSGAVQAMTPTKKCGFALRDALSRSEKRRKASEECEEKPAKVVKRACKEKVAEPPADLVEFTVEQPDDLPSPSG
eukprot:1224637-Amphidinium_carterae.1